MADESIADLVSKPSKAEYTVYCDVVGCGASAAVKDANSAEAAYAAKYGVAPDTLWLPEGWRSVSLPVLPRSPVRTARVSEIVAVTDGAFVVELDHGGQCTFTICPDPAHGDDPELRGPWEIADVARQIKNSACTCPTACDCEDAAHGLVSNECPEHNDEPRPSDTCLVHGRGSGG